MRAQRETVRGQQRRNLLLERRVGQQHGLCQFGLLDGIVHRCVRTWIDSVFRGGRLSDLFGHRHVGFAQQLYEPSVRERCLHRRVHPRGDALFRKQHPGLQFERFVGLDDRVRGVGMRQRLVHRRVRARDDPVFRQRRPNL